MQSASIGRVPRCGSNPLPWNHRAARAGAEDWRLSLRAGRDFLVEDFAASALRPGRGHSPDFQVVLPYHGAFRWRVGAAAHFVDANSILFVRGGQDYAETHPIPGVGHASVVITLRPRLLDEFRLERPRGDGGRFAEVVGPNRDGLRMLTHAILRLNEYSDPLEADELAIEALREALGASIEPAAGARPRIVDRAREVLQAYGEARLSLGDIARQVGASPTYLTQAFTRWTGMPLYRYQTRLRLARALVQLPKCESLTGLALDLGFSSHSHFTAMFRAAFGLSPSAFRARYAGPGRDFQTGANSGFHVQAEVASTTDRRINVPERVSPAAGMPSQ